MDIHIWLAFVAATSILLIIPGPTILTVISYSISYGKRVRLPLVIAVALGDSTALALSLLGLGALLANSALLFQIVKWIGGLYLLYLGLKLFWSGVKTTAFNTVERKDSGYRLFLNTYLVTALNPKGIVFFIAFLPQFISAEHDLNPQLWILSITFVSLAMINAGLYVAFASQARELLSSIKMQRAFNTTGGSLLSFAGIWALTAEPIE